MIVSRAVTDNLKKASGIRRMFEEGARLKQELGADRVFDFTLGNPEIEPPAAVLAAARRVLDSGARHLHAYMLASAPGRPASDNGRLCQGAGGHARGGRCRRAFMLTILTVRARCLYRSSHTSCMRPKL